MPIGYTPPAGNAVIFNFTGAYTPPAGNAVALNFVNPVVVTLDPGSYAIAGTAVGLKVGRRLRAANNIVVNGQFNVDASSWNIAGADTTLTSIGRQGVLALGPAASDGYAWQAVAVEPGRAYTLSAFLRPTNAYVLTADPGAYALTGTAAALSVGSGGGGGGGGSAVTFTGDNIEAVEYAFWTLWGDGYIYKQTDAGLSTQSGTWITPQIGMSDYEVRATKISGNTPTGSLNTWIGAEVGGTWGFHTTTTDRMCTLTIDIRRKSDLAVVASGDVSILAMGPL